MEEPSVSVKDRLVASFYMGEALGNAEKSCIMAGYSERYARGNAYKIVARSGVQKYIQYLQSLTQDEKIATIKEIQTFWTDLMLNGEVKTSDRIRASELLAKSQGAFTNDW